MKRIAVLASHPIQTLSPWLRALAQRVDLTVYYARRLDAHSQGRGFGEDFQWDVDLLAGYRCVFGMRALLDCVKAQAVDAVVVCGWARREYWMAVLACRRSGVAVLVRGDGQLLGPRARWKKRVKSLLWPYMLRTFDGFLVVGRHMRAYLRRYRVPSSLCFASPHCIDNQRFAAAAEVARGHRPELRAQWDIPAGVPLVLYVGKLNANKRVMDMLYACERLRHKGIPLHAVIVGNGPQYKHLNRSAEISGVPTTFTGFCNQSALPAWYDLADVLVLPSVSESWGLVVNEAMACGTPVVVTEAVACAPDLVKPGVTGEVAAVGDVHSLADAIGRVLMRGKGGSVELALERRIAKYSPEIAADGLVAALNRLLPE